MPDWLLSLAVPLDIGQSLLLACRQMDSLDFGLSMQEVREWFESYALPRLDDTAALIVLALVIWVFVWWGMRRLHRHLVSRTETELDDAILLVVRRVALLSIGFWTVVRLIEVWTAEPDPGQAPEPSLLAPYVKALWVLALSFPISRFVTDLLEIAEEKIVPRTTTKLDDTALPLMNRFVQFLIVGIGALMALQVLEIQITPLLGGAGVAGLALSFAAKDTLSNLIAGVLLILDRPFQVGDRIELWNAPKNSSTWGDVMEIGLRATKIRTPDNIVIIIPNNEIMQRDIINYTASGTDIRLRVPIGISYDANAHKAKEIILAVTREIEGIKQSPEPVVIIRRFGDSAVDLEARVWLEDARKRRAIEDQLTDKVKNRFDEEGIEIPYPKRDLYIKHAPVSEEDSKESGPSRPEGSSRTGRS